MATNRTRGGRKKEMSNLKIRQNLWETLPADKQRSRKRPGSNKK